MNVTLNCVRLRTLKRADMNTFDILCTRISTSMFKDIVCDIQITLNQYGEFLDHQNVEARSRCLAPVSISIILHSLAFYFVAHAYY